MLNIMEDLVLFKLKENWHLLNIPCACIKCKTDVLALTLNSLPSKYVVRKEGGLYIKTKYDLECQLGTDILCALASAAKKVSKNPSHIEEGTEKVQII